MSSDLADRQPVSPRPADEQLTAAELERLELFSAQSASRGLERYCEAINLRWLEPGDAIVSIGGDEPVVFYLISWEEVLRLKIEQLESAESAYERLLTNRDQHQSEATAEIQQWIEQLSTMVARFERRAWQRSAADVGADESQAVARLELQPAPVAPDQGGGMLKKFSRRLFGGRESAVTDAPNDSLDIEFFEGEVFDSSEFPAAAFSGKLTALIDTYVLQLPRALYLQLANDEGWQKAADNAFRQRVLPQLLRRLPIFQQLDEDDLDSVCTQAQLISADPGAVICDEHQLAESMYLVRSGAVEATSGQTSLLSVEAIPDLRGLCQALEAGAKRESG